MLRSGTSSNSSPRRRSVLWTGLFCCVALSVLATPSRGSGFASRPDPSLTPGATRRVTLREVCALDASREPRPVPAAMADAVFGAYDLAPAHRAEWEIDHLIPRALGGATVADNLWPLPKRAGPWSGARKRELERHLRFLVCHGGLPLHRAQRALAADWIEAYATYIGAPARALRFAGTPP